ncbi:MAG: homoserine dehydrogenase, partial [Paenibacillaceae bacterium]|nr:homoserine dehydrogenase [Paenibacillaceae bacterium]
MMNVAVMGYGTIGSGVVEILEQNKDIIARQTGDTVNVKYILDLREFPGTPIEKKIVHDFSVIEKDPEVSMVIETMGGLNPAYPFVKA